MCGICGVFYPGGPHWVDPGVLAAMNGQLTHRGPDDDGSFLDQNIGLAVRRLSIIDLHTGHQPIANEDETVWIAYNGEIYNHQELRADLEARGHRYRTQSDTETILHLYEEYGRECVKHLRGMFAFAIWDKRKRGLFAARDRLGIKPFYYRNDGTAFLFGSEIKAILAHPGVKAELNHATLAQYLAFGYLAGPETMFAGIRSLLPGHSLEIGQDGEIRVERYWDLAPVADLGQRPRSHYVRTYRELLEESVSSHLMSDVPLGVFLSGGLDSSVIAALTTRIRRAPIETFSVGYAEEPYSELFHARQVSQRIGSRHHEVHLAREEFFQSLPRLIWHQDGPLAWPSSVALYCVARLAREQVKVVLTGEGADETLAGYTRYAWTLKNARMDRLYRALIPEFLRAWTRKGIISAPLSAALHRKLAHTFLLRKGESWPSFYFDNFYSAFSAEDQGSLLSNATKAVIGDAYASSMEAWERSSGDMLHRLLSTDIQTYLVELLMKQDRMSMAASIESRVPFLDHRLVEFSATIPAKFLIEGLSGKRILKSMAHDLLPEPTIHRKKMGFPTPWDSWLAGPQLHDLEKLLLEPRTQQRGWFKPDAVAALFAQHRARQRDHANRIWRLLNLELWQRIFLDGDLLAGDVLPVDSASAVSSPGTAH